MNTCTFASQEIIDRQLFIWIFVFLLILVFFIFTEHSLLWTCLVFGSSPSKDLISKTGSSFDRHMQYYRQTQNNIINIGFEPALYVVVKHLVFHLRFLQGNICEIVLQITRSVWSIFVRLERHWEGFIHLGLTVNWKWASLFQHGKPTYCI